MNPNLFACLGAFALVVAPIAVVRKAGAAWRWPLLGILSWGIAVVAKTIATASLAATVMVGASPWMQGLVYGAISALTELGAAAFFLRRARLSLADMVAFGVGIGAFEVLFTIALGLLESLDAQPVPSLAGRIDFIDGFFVWERGVAFCGHVASRLLVCVSIVQRRWLPAVMALVGFILTDGAASFGMASGWDWSSANLLTRYLAFASVVCLLETAAALVFVRRSGEWPRKGP